MEIPHGWCSESGSTSSRCGIPESQHKARPDSLTYPELLRAWACKATLKISAVFCVSDFPLVYVWSIGFKEVYSKYNWSRASFCSTLPYLPRHKVLLSDPRHPRHSVLNHVSQIPLEWSQENKVDHPGGGLFMEISLTPTPISKSCLKNISLF